MEQNYKDLYEQAIARAKQHYPDYIVENIFPELAESEDDEKIRKVLLNNFKNNYSEYCCDGVNRDMIIAWLEKQGEQPKKHDVCDYCDQQGSCVSPCPMKLVEKQAEQKPADKVEPKFHELEWITNGDYTWQIDNVTDLDYILRTQDGNIVDDTISHVDEQFHSFTIGDAKGGDVLATEPIEGYHSPFVAIYKKQNEEDFDSYCFIGFDGKFYKGENGHSTEKIHPATKEQRDVLFAKMKEAGYEWDAEKKKLRKIEQESFWSEEDDEHLERILKELGNQRQRPLNSPYLDKIESDYNWLKSLRPQSHWKPSDAQMASISCAVRKMKESACYDSELVSLFNDLKKLIEE